MHFKIKNIFILSAGLTFIAVAACRAQQRQKEKTIHSSSLLWQISGNGIVTPSYLFGTIHLICPDKFLWTPKMKKALDNSEKIAFEMDMDDPNLVMEVSAGMMLPDSLSLNDYFNQKDYTRLEKYAKDTLGIPAIALKRMQPFAVLSLAIMKNSTCTEEPIAYEQKISSWAEAKHKEIVGLESAEDQLDIMNGMNKDSTAKQIIQLLNQPKKLKKQYQQLLSAFLSQDLDALHHLIMDSPDMRADLNTLLYQRNKKWIPLIEKLIHEQATFIAVGVGHLAGNRGVIQLLRQAGYTLQPVL